MEKDIHDYFSLPFYWAQAGYGGLTAPGIVSAGAPIPETGEEDEVENYSHLHSAKTSLRV